jgi:hypothetical protein
MRTGLILALLFTLGVAVNLHFGRRGFLPLDQSIVFDGGWRMLNGQMPFRDFTTPSAIVPSAMQVPFFALFGVTWFALCLHAAVVNGLFCMAVYGFLRLSAATVWEACAFGALSAFFFYPPTGTPFTDQHSFFFTMLMLLAVAVGSRDAVVWRARAAWFAVPALFMLGLLSCQIPMAFAAMCVAVWVFANPRRAPEWMAALAAGTLAVGVALVLVALVARLDLRSAFAHVIAAPFQQGSARTPTPGVLSPVRMVLGTMRRLPAWAHLWSLNLAIASMLLVPFGAKRNVAWPFHVWALAALIISTAGFVAYSKTPTEAGLGLAMAIAGIGAIVIRLALTNQRWQLVALAVVAIAVGRDTVRFVQLVDVPGTIHKAFDPRAADAAEGHLPEGLSFMRWSRGASHYEPEELSALVRYLRDADGDFLLIGDSTVLYGLTGKVSPIPALWLDPRLTFPAADSPEFPAFEADLIARVRAFGVRRIVLEGPRTWGGVSLNDFPRLKRLAAVRACGEKTFGDVRVLEMCSDL